MLNLNEIGKKQQSELEKNIMFVTTIYDTFEALEETIGKLKLERPLFLIYLAKQAFAEEVFKYFLNMLKRMSKSSSLKTKKVIRSKLCNKGKNLIFSVVFSKKMTYNNPVVVIYGG